MTAMSLVCPTICNKSFETGAFNLCDSDTLLLQTRDSAQNAICASSSFRIVFVTLERSLSLASAVAPVIVITTELTICAGVWLCGLVPVSRWRLTGQGRNPAASVRPAEHS